MGGLSRIVETVFYNMSLLIRDFRTNSSVCLFTDSIGGFLRVSNLSLELSGIERSRFLTAYLYELFLKQLAHFILIHPSIPYDCWFSFSGDLTNFESGGNKRHAPAHKIKTLFREERSNIHWEKFFFPGRGPRGRPYSPAPLYFRALTSSQSGRAHTHKTC